MPTSKTGSWFQDGARFQDGTLQTTAAFSNSVFPNIEGSLQVLDTTVPQTVSFVPTVTTLVAVSLYMSNPGAGTAGHTLTVTVSYTCELGAETISIVMTLDVPQIVMETYPLLCIGGTTISLTTAYTGGAVNDMYSISARLVQMA